MRIHFYVSLIDLNTALFNRPGTCTVHFVTLHEVEGFQRIQDLFKTWSRHGHGPLLTQGTQGTLKECRVAAFPEMMGHNRHSFHAKILGIDVKWCEMMWITHIQICGIASRTYCYDTPSRTIWGVSYLRSPVISSVACLKIPSFDDCSGIPDPAEALSHSTSRIKGIFCKCIRIWDHMQGRTAQTWTVYIGKHRMFQERGCFSESAAGFTWICHGWIFHILLDAIPHNHPIIHRSQKMGKPVMMCRSSQHPWPQLENFNGGLARAIISWCHHCSIERYPRISEVFLCQNHLFIWVYNISLTWKPFGDGFPKINHDSSQPQPSWLCLPSMSISQ